MLIFLFRFAEQHIELSKRVDASAYAEYLDDQLEAFRIAESSSKVIEVPREFTVVTSCDGFGVAEIKKSNKLVFAPPTLQGTVSAWTEAWDFPYRVANLYYLSDSALRIFLVYDETSASFVRGLEIPSLFNVQKMHVRDFSAERLRRESSTEQVHVVFFTPARQRDILMRMPNVRIIEVNLAAQTVKLARGTSTYVDEHFLIGALLAPETFACVQEKALESFRMVTDVYLRKADLLRLKTARMECQPALAEVHKTLEDALQTQNIAQLAALRKHVEEQNNYLRRNDCVQIY